jgi:hypothetical protein
MLRITSLAFIDLVRAGPGEGLAGWPPRAPEKLGAHIFCIGLLYIIEKENKFMILDGLVYSWTFLFSIGFQSGWPATT